MKVANVLNNARVCLLVGYGRGFCLAPPRLLPLAVEPFSPVAGLQSRCASLRRPDQGHVNPTGCTASLCHLVDTGERWLVSEAVSELEIDFLLSQAKRCRTVAAGTTDERTRTALLAMAQDYEEQADALRLAEKSDRPSEPR